MRVLVISIFLFTCYFIVGYTLSSQLRNEEEQLPVLDGTNFYGTIKDEGILVEGKQILYRIRWHSVNTAATGYGSEGFPLEQAIGIAKQLNEINQRIY